MPLYSSPLLQQIIRQHPLPMRKSASAALGELAESALPGEHYDIFLSHRYADADEIWALAHDIEAMRYSVFVDWIANPSMRREDVNSDTADWLRDVMERCSCLVYVHSVASPTSAWMPWELGYCDGSKGGKAAVLPITYSPTPTEVYQGQEYLGLYPYVARQTVRGTSRMELWVHESPNTYVCLREWLGGYPPEPR